MSEQVIQTVFKGIKSSFIKATIYSRDLQAFKDLGFVESVELLTEEAEVENVAGHQKSGENWDLIKNLLSKDEVELLVKEKTGVDIDKRGSLETVKEKALAVLNESKRTDS